tara:strand:- start:338 stop:757 length:420 start_codon:yes stop_codon:yes gene_type:complete
MSDTEHTIRHWDGKVSSLPADVGRVSKKAAHVVDVGRAALHVVRALRWTDAQTMRDVPKPRGEGMTTGWNYNSHTRVAMPMWSTSVTHGHGHERKSGSQQGIALFSTKLRALRALRRAVEVDCARKLAAIDEQIRAEGG